MSWRALPPRARRLLLATVIGGVGMAALAVLQSAAPPAPVLLTMLAAGIAFGEALRIDLSYRAGGTATFGLSDAALTAGLLVLTGTDVVLGAAMGILAIHLVERLDRVKLLLNTAQYVAGAAAAAVLVQTLTPHAGPVSLSAALQPESVGAVALGMTAFLMVNTTTVAGMIALTSGAPWRATWLRLLPTGATLTFGNLALGLLAVVVLDARPWVLPALLVPVGLLWSASRQSVRAQIDRERSAAFVEVEHRLGAAATPEAVAEVLAEAAGRVLGCSGAVCREGRWLTPVPAGSSAPPTGPEAFDRLDATAVAAPARALGLALDSGCLTVGLGSGALVVWSGEMGLAADAAGWVERLGRSGRVHIARAMGAVSLEQERATLRAVVDGTGDGVLLLGPDGTVRVWNPAMAELSGIPADEAVGRGAAALLGDGPWDADGVHDLHHTGTDSVWRTSVASIEDADGQHLRVVGVHDVTAERRAAQMRDDMLAVVSHELRTPLTPIKGCAQLLRRRGDRLDEDRRQQLLSSIEERADHLARLVDDLLLVGQLSGVVSGSNGVAGPVDAGQVITDATAALALSHPAHPVRAEVAAPVQARIEPVHLRQILDHLLDNACKFSSPGSLVEVRLGADDAAGEAVIEVADHGRGIPPADLERVFERFVRGEDPLVMTTSGAGLGLFIVRELARAAGGAVRLRSQLGKGTTATVRLPLQPAAEAAAGPPAAGSPTTPVR